MSVNLNIICNFEVTARGVTFTGRQGADTSAENNDAFIVSVTGDCHQMAGTLATATALKVWDDDTHKPSDFTYMFFVADVDMYIQIVGTATNATLNCVAGVPFILSYDQILAAANTTDISGSAPSMEDIDHVVIQNNSGGDGNYFFACVN